MGWSLTAPTRPSGSSWVQKGTTTWESNNLKITSVVYFARMTGTGFALKVVETRTWYKNDVKASYLRCDVNGSNAGASTSLTWTATSGTRTAYFTGTAAAGVAIKVYVGQDNDGTNYGTTSFTAPALLGDVVYVKVSGAWKKASAVYVKVSGAWKTGPVKFKTGGAWK